MNMNQASRGSRVVFVGNIPFELSEEQLIEVFKEVGPVASFRLLFDRDTGRPKGYGFCEFFDAETAASAVRNLNDYEIGGRQLRVDYAAMDDNQSRGGAGGGGAGNQNFNQNQNRHQGGNMNMGGPPPPQQMQPPPMQMQQQQPMLMQQHVPMQQNMPMQQAPPPSVQQQQPVANLSSVDEISKVLASMSAQDLFTLMSQMKQMSHERPDFTKEFLASNPQVAYALFQAMIMMNIVDPNTITRIMSEQPIVQAATPVQPVVVTPQMPVMQAPQPIRQPPPVVPQQQPMMNNPLPIPNQMSPQLPEDGPEQQKALLMRVLQLTDEQINALPPQARDQIRILKNQLTTQQQ